MNVVDIVDEQDLEYFRKAYRTYKNQLTASARQQVITPYPQAALAISSLGDYFFVPDSNGKFPMAESDRERCIISVLVAADIDPGFVLAVHLYWGICVNLSAKEVADIILLASLYSGIPHWAVNIHRFRIILMILKKLVDDAKAEFGTGPGAEERILERLAPERVSKIIRDQTTFATLEQMAQLQKTVNGAAPPVPAVPAAEADASGPTATLKYPTGRA